MSDLSQLQRDKADMENERDALVEAIRGRRARARQKSLEASSTRQPLPETEIAFWKTGIAKHQTELMAVQGKIAAVNQELRKLSLTHRFVLYRNYRVRWSSLVTATAGDPRQRRLTTGMCFDRFFNIARDSLDPRLLEALERDARQLAADYQHMHGGAS